MSDALRIVKLEAENFKGLKAVEITPDGNLVEITGRNGQGKSSVLDSIWAALAGASVIDPVPIRTGQTEARIRLDLGEIIVTRHFTERENGPAATRLTVETAEGARFPSPQALLDGLLGALAFDPLAFSRLPASDQYKQIRDMVGLDFAADDAANRVDFDKRTEANREAKAARAAADAIDVPEDTPAELISVSAIVQQVRDAEATNRAGEGERRRREHDLRRIVESRDEADRAESEATSIVADAAAQAAELLKQAEALQARAAARATANRQRSAALINASNQKAEALAALPPVDTDTDTAEMQREIEAAEQTNEHVRQAQRRRALMDDHKYAAAEADALTDRMGARRAKNREAIEAADMPVEGLGLADGVLTLHDRPLVQASEGEKLDVSCAIAMRQNGRLKVVRIKEGSLLDQDRKARIAKMAAERGYQVWMETVDGKIGIVIEAGEVKS